MVGAPAGLPRKCTPEYMTFCTIENRLVSSYYDSPPEVSKVNCTLPTRAIRIIDDASTCRKSVPTGVMGDSSSLQQKLHAIMPSIFVTRHCMVSGKIFQSPERVFVLFESRILFAPSDQSQRPEATESGRRSST